MTPDEGESIADVLAQAHALLEELKQDVEDARAEGRAAEEARRESEELAARERRAGKDGPDWQVLQRRIDLNQTTLRDILGGVDKSIEAQNARRVLGQHIISARERLAEILDPDALEEARQAQQELAERLRATRGRPVVD